MSLSYQDILNYKDLGHFSVGRGTPADLAVTLEQYGLSKPTSFNLGSGNISGAGLRQELLNRMMAGVGSPQQQVPSYNGGPAGQPANQAPLPQGTNSGYQAPANAANPVKDGPSWQAGPQAQQLPEGTQSPYGQAWGGGEGTTYSPITMNQQANLLSQNHQAPNGWMNGLLYNSPWEEYYGVQGGNGLL